MESSRKNKSLFLTREIKSMLEMCAHGLLKPVTALMNQHEYDMVNASGTYQGMSLPFPFILAPNGKKNLAVLKAAKPKEKLRFVCDGQVFGEIYVQEIFAIDKESFFKKLMGGDLTSKKAKTLYNE
ncbi:MAG: sulfate adenylyltransferase, partial [Helicobacter sp.]|nr:sulfate adenylyltransferase [Helicobacter sp.]